MPTRRPRPLAAALLGLALLALGSSGCATWSRISTGRLVDWPREGALPDAQIDSPQIMQRAGVELERLSVGGVFAAALEQNELTPDNAGLRYRLPGKSDRIWGAGGDLVAVVTIHPPIWFGGRLAVRFDAEANGKGSDDSPSRRAWEAFLITLETHIREGLERAVKDDPPPAEAPADPPADGEGGEDPPPRGP